jgi:hypothetical protein
MAHNRPFQVLPRHVLEEFPARRTLVCDDCFVPEFNFATAVRVCVPITYGVYAGRGPKDLYGAITASYTVSLSLSAVVSHSFAAHFFFRYFASVQKRKSSFFLTAEKMKRALLPELYSCKKLRVVGRSSLSMLKISRRSSMR